MNIHARGHQDGWDHSCLEKFAGRFNPFPHSIGLDFEPALFLSPLQGPRIRAYRVLEIKDAGPTNQHTLFDTPSAGRGPWALEQGPSLDSVRSFLIMPFDPSPGFSGGGLPTPASHLAHPVISFYGESFLLPGTPMSGKGAPLSSLA